MEVVYDVVVTIESDDWETDVIVVSGVMVVTGVVVVTVSYVETLNVEMTVVAEEKVVDPRTVDTIVFDDGKLKDEDRVAMTDVDADGVMESDNVWTPVLTDNNPGIETDLSGDNAVMGGVVTGKSVTVKARDPSTCGA